MRLDDFIINNSYDAYEEEFEKMMDLWDVYCKEVADEEADDLKN